MELETEIAILKHDVSRIINLFEKMDTAIEKMGDVSNSIAKMLAVHEEKINSGEEIEEKLFSLVEQRRGEMQVDIKELHSRITTVSRELSTEITETEDRLMDAFVSGMTEIKQCITEEHKINKEEIKHINSRLDILERWRWVILGGSIVAASFAHEIITLVSSVFKVR